MNGSLWLRFKYLWLVLIGWGAFFVLQLMRTPLTFWLGVLMGIVFSIASIVSSAFRLGKSMENIILHSIAWILAVALGLLSGIYIYAVLRGV